jgi:hypothetical protein
MNKGTVLCIVLLLSVVWSLAWATNNISANFGSKESQPVMALQTKHQVDDSYAVKLAKDAEFKQRQDPPVIEDVLLSEGFENGGNIPAGWIDSFGDYPWMFDGGYNNGPGSAHGGYYAAFFNVYNYSSGVIDSLISPSIDFSSHSGNYMINYWSYHSSGSDSVIVYLSEGGALTRLGKLPNSTVWTSNTYAFSSMSTNGKIYFVGYSNWGSHNPYIDDVTVQDAPTIGRCCFNDPSNPDCADMTHGECNSLDGAWTPGASCANDPCPVLLQGENCTVPIFIPSIPFSDTRTTCGYLDDYGVSGPDVIYKMVLAQPMTLDISTCNSSIDWDTELYLWGNGDCGTPNFIASADFGCTNSYNLSLISGISLQAGTYYISVDGWFGFCNQYTLDVTQAIPCVTECPPGSIPEGEALGDSTNDGCTLLAPAFGAISCGETVCGLSYYDGDRRDSDWYLFSLTDNQIVTLKAVADFNYVIGICVPNSSDPCDFPGYLTYSATSRRCDTATVTVALQGPGPGIYIAYIAPDLQTSRPFVRGNYWMSMTCETPPPIPPNDLCENAIEVPIPSSTQGTTAYAFIDNNYPSCSNVSISGPGVWYKVIGNGDTLTATTCNTYTNFDTKLHVYCGSCGSALCVTANDNDYNCIWNNSKSTVQWQSKDGDMYLILISSFSDPGLFQLDITSGGPSASPFQCEPCEVNCPPGSTPEGEPNCGPDYVDMTNGGCDSNPPIFGGVTIGETICGASGTFESGGYPWRDTDWYTLHLSETKIITVTGKAEFPVFMSILGGSCSNQRTFASEAEEPCSLLTMSSVLVPGDYWVYITTQGYSGVEPGSRYFFTVNSSDYVCPTDINIGNLNAAVPFQDVNTTCGKLDKFHGGTCMSPYDTGPDVLYQFEVTAPISLNITLTPDSTTSGILLDSSCPPNPTTCIAMATSNSAAPVGFNVFLQSGTYYVMVDNSPDPPCTDYTLDITRLPMSNIILDPTAIDGNASPGRQDNRVLTISNTGDAQLDFHAITFINPPAISGALAVDDHSNPMVERSYNSQVIEKLASNGIPSIPDRNIILQGGDNIASATPIPSIPYDDIGSTMGYTNDYDEVCPYEGGGAPDVVYAYTAAADTFINISLCTVGTNFDTKLYVYDNIYTPGAPYACNDDACTGYRSKIDNMAAISGHTYFIIVDGYGINAGDYELIVEAAAPPPGCPTGALLGQNPTSPTDNWSFRVADIDRNLTAFENIGVYGNITEIHFWGDDAYNNGYWWVDCDQVEPAHFRIGFYSDFGGVPGAAYQLLNVEAAVTIVNNSFSGIVQKAYTVTLPSPVFVNAGWISIQATDAGDNCWFLLQNSLGSGDGHCLWWNGISYEVFDYDISLCLIGTSVNPWLTIDSNGGAIPPGAPAVPIQVTMDATGLANGTYLGAINVGSNDLVHPAASVPVTFTVGAPGCNYFIGDINGNNSVNGVDIVYAVNYFKGSGAPPPIDCFSYCPLTPSPFYAAGDVNGNCAFNGIDITYFVRYLKLQVPSLLFCPDCPPAGVIPPVTAVRPIGSPVLNAPVKGQSGGPE